MTKKFNMTRDINGFNGFGLPPSDDKFNVVLSVGVAQTLCTVPNNFEEWLAIFSFAPGTSIWVAYNTSATLPTGTAGTTVSELNPTAIKLSRATTISVITSDTTAAAGVKLYAL